MLPAGAIVPDDSAPLAHAAFTAAGGEDHGGDVTLLLAPPRAVTSLSLRAGWVLTGGALSLTLLALAGLSMYWPIRVEENFESYLQCDGPHHARLQRYREMAAAAKEVGIAPLRQLQRSRTPEQTEAHYLVKVIYSTVDGSNIFTPAHLAYIREMELRLAGCASFSQFCLVMQSGKCLPPLSVINYFYASVDPVSGDLIPDGEGTSLQDIQDILVHLATENQYFVDRYFGVSASALKTILEGNITRSVFRFGLPFHGFASRQDRLQEQDSLFRNFVADEFLPQLQQEAASSVRAGLRVNFYGPELSAYEVEMTVWHDAFYAIGSLSFIALYLIVHLRSFFLAFAALGCIALSFPLSYIVFCLCFGYGQMIAINFLSLFVVLGVGADDVFVLADVWSHSRAHGMGDIALARRLWNMYRKAGLAIFATSATTAASFFANLTSSIGPLREFGFFMGTCIAVNWLVVASLYPFALVVHERWGRGVRPQFPGASGAGGVAVLRDSEMEQQLVEEACRGTGWSVSNVSGLHGNGHFVPPLQQLADASPRSAPRPMSMGKEAAWRAAVASILLCGLALPSLALWEAAQRIEPDNGLPQFFPPSSNLGALQSLQMRFGNETRVNTLEMKHCSADGLLKTEAACEAVSQRIPGQLVNLADGSAQKQTGHEGATHTPKIPHNVVDPGTQAPEAVHDFDLQFSVQGYSPSELEALSFMFKGELLHELGLQDDNVEVVVDSTPQPADPSAAEADAALSVRRLAGATPASSIGGDAVDEAPASLLTLHFRGLTRTEERRVRAFLSAHRHEIEQHGAAELSKAPSPPRAPAPAQPHTAPSPPSAPPARHPEVVPLPQPQPWQPQWPPRSTTPRPPPPVTRAPPAPAAQRPATYLPWRREPPSHTTPAWHGTQVPGITTTLPPWSWVVGPSSAAPAPSRPSGGLVTRPAGTARPGSTTSVAPAAHLPPASFTTPTAAAWLTTTSTPASTRSSAYSGTLPPALAGSFTAPTAAAWLTTTSTPASTRSSVSAVPTLTTSPTTTTTSSASTTPVTTARAAAAFTTHALVTTTTRRSGVPSGAHAPPLAADDDGADARQTTTTTTHGAATKPHPTAKPVPQLHLHKRGMARDRQAMVYLLWGLDPSGSGTSFKAKADFDMRSSLGQNWLTAVCDKAAATPALKVTEVDCWPANFDNFLRSRSMPSPSFDTNRDLRMFFGHEKHWVGTDVGFHPGPQLRPAWVRVGFRVLFDTHSSGRQIQPFMEEWEKFVAVENLLIKSKGARMLGDAVVMSDLFERAEAELRVIGSAVTSWIVSVACALVAVALFTRSFVLSAIATFAIFATAACSVYTIICVFGWRFGLMEAVSLIIFCGFSVDYPLHVVQAYVQERGRGAKVSNALREVGCAVASGCATTCGAAMFLLLCEIRIFTRFGQVLIANMTFSLMFALLWIPAALESRTLCSRCFRRSAAGGSARSSASLPGVRLSDALSEAEAPDGFEALSGGTPRGTPRLGR